jgi:hypothetical protein
MSAERDVTRVVRSWIRDDEHDSADYVLQTVLSRLDATPQRRPLWPLRRIAEMTTYTKLWAAAAAVIALVIVGGALMFREGIGPGTTPGPSAVPTTGGPTGTAPAPTTTASEAALLPGEFTACVPSNSEVKTGTRVEEVVSTADGDVKIERTRGFTWSGTITATDERFSGTHSYSWDGNGYTPGSADPHVAMVEGLASWAEGHRIENSDGAWTGSTVGITFPDGTNEGSPAVLTGEGAYAGLTAVLLVAEGPCFFNYRGIVMEVPDPPVPFTGG